MYNAIFKIVLAIISAVALKSLINALGGGKNNSFGQIGGDINKKIIVVNASANLSTKRKSELTGIADSLHVSMEGFGTYLYDWTEQMKYILTDDEFVYMESAFGVRDGDNFREWIADENQLNQQIQIVNKFYADNGMTIKL